jgi:hypothetical protein
VQQGGFGVEQVGGGAVDEGAARGGELDQDGARVRDPEPGRATPEPGRVVGRVRRGRDLRRCGHHLTSVASGRESVASGRELTMASSSPLLIGRLYERRTLALERLGRTAAPAVSDGLRHGIGEDVLLTFVHRVEDGPRDGLRGGLGDVQHC